MDMNKLRLIAIYGLVFSAIFLFFALMKLTFFILGDHMKTMEYAYAIENDWIDEKNLTLPIPKDSLDTLFVNNGIIDKGEFVYQQYFYKDVQEYSHFIEDVFIYDVDSYDCKYWTYVHMLYWKANKDVYNWKFEVIDTDNHVFGMIYNDSGYITLDQNNINCYGNMGC